MVGWRPRWPAGLVLVVAIAFPALGCDRAIRPVIREGFLLGGIQVNEPNMDRWHRRLAATGFNTVALTVYARQQAWNRAEITFDPDQLGGDTVREIQSAKRRGLRVVLVLRLALEGALAENRFLWHGMVMPETDAELDAWFSSYREFVVAWAEVCEHEGVDVLGIASELSALASTTPVAELPVLEEYYLNEEKQERERARVLATGAEPDPEHLVAGWGDLVDSLPRYLDERSRSHAAWAQAVTGGGDLERLNERRRRLDAGWRALIAKVRSRYSGRLTYAANFDQYQRVGFWDALDVVGINAYFPLRSDIEMAPGRELEETFTESWRRILTDLVEFRRRRGIADRPVLFTELGYTPRRGSTIEPWAGRGFGVLGEAAADPGSGTSSRPQMVIWEREPLAPEERALAVRGLRRALRDVDPELLMGLLYWKLSTQPAHRAIEPFVLLLDRDRPRDPLWAELVDLAAGEPDPGSGPG